MSSDPAPKMSEVVARELRREIISGELAAGGTLRPLAELTERFDVSAPTLREAMRILEAERLIEMRRGSRGGAFVLEPDPEVAARQVAMVLQHRNASLRDVSDAFVLLQGQVVARLAAHRTKADLKALRDGVEQVQAVVDDPASFVVAGNEFHRLLATRCGNRTLDLCVILCSGVLVESANRLVARDAAAERPAIERTAAAVAEVVDLVEAGDPDAAKEFWTDHLQAMTDHLADSDRVDVVS